ncbi:hypothetical protein AARAC_002797 [Aspergillus arachidicola]|uniref:Uncharacterized protein n=1 Tax=Aspergillus arachidicola TaxID=656916 RepID=A0A2G7FZP7_9EURO|nr:hypothetical protein AARAC_002797 [Aspergillus arachidicola]
MGSNETGPKTNRSWTEVVAAKRAIRNAQIREHEAANRNGSFDIFGADIADVQTLTNLLGSGQVAAEDIVRAYIESGSSAPVHMGTSRLNQGKGNPTPKGVDTTPPTRHMRQLHGRLSWNEATILAQFRSG